jgi:hypothetical protein
MRAAEEMEMLWKCWFLFFRRLHEKTDQPAPLGWWEYCFEDVVHYHKMMVRR